MELAVSVHRCAARSRALTDWRGHVERHRDELMVGAPRSWASC